LLNGAAVLPFSVATEGVHRLSRWLGAEKITIFHWVPSAFRHFLAVGAGDETFPGVRAVILGSEPVTSRELELCRKHFSAGCKFFNRFGTTETGNICLYSIDKNARVGADGVPVGFALEDLEVLLLDEAGNEAAPGQVGEIAVKSPYFCGYWRQPELTRARFAPDAAAPDKTIYRSGDMGYILPDGSLVHLGRNDLQVKVRGHRVDLGRVERALLEHPEVSEAAVVTRGEPPDDTRLAAYVVGKTGAGPESGALRGFLEARLPAYMVPGTFTRLDALPTTPAGKLDRRGFPEPTVETVAADDRYVAPRNALERKIALVWSEILELPRVGIHDGFLELGGHSLLAGKIVWRLSEVCGFEIGFREFFEHPTVAQLAEFLSRSGPAEQRAGMPPENKLVSDKETHDPEKENNT
jgi:acyl-coenzyme A synthetase/AMP-(fatty) acid ligase